MRKPVEIGIQYGRLIPIDYYHMERGYHYYLCECSDCGLVQALPSNTIFAEIKYPTKCKHDFYKKMKALDAARATVS